MTCRRSSARPARRRDASASGSSCAMKEYFAGFPAEERADRLRQQTDAGHPESDTTAVSWPTSTGSRWAGARSSRGATTRAWSATIASPGQDREEDKADDSVWAVTCFFIRRRLRKHGVSRELARAAVSFARDRGARAIEGHSIITTDVIMEELRTKWALSPICSLVQPTTTAMPATDRSPSPGSSRTPCRWMRSRRRGWPPGSRRQC